MVRFPEFKVFTELYLHIWIFNTLHLKHKLVNDCSDDNLIVALAFSDLGQSCVLPVVYTCSQVAKTQVWVLGTTHLNTFKSGMSLLLSLSTVLNPTACQAINTFLLTLTQFFKHFK